MTDDVLAVFLVSVRIRIQHFRSIRIRIRSQNHGFDDQRKKYS
jgi:hypothetical protein